MAQIESFFLGILAALGALVFEFVIFMSYFLYKNPSGEISLASFFAIPAFIIIAAAIEEIFKYIVIAKRVDAFSLEKSYIFNSFLVGLGFFAVEFGIIMQTIGMKNPRGFAEIAILHIGTAGIIGYRIAIGNPKKIGTLLSTLAIVTLFHGAYNFISAKPNFLSSYLTMALLAVLILANIFNIFRLKSKLA